MRFDYARPDGLWVDESVFGMADARRWDDTQSRGINAVDGDTVAPSKPIVLGGAGVRLNSVGCQIAGGWKTTRGGRVLHNANDFTQLSPARTRKIVMPLHECVTGDGGTLGLIDDPFISVVTSPAFGIAISSTSGSPIQIPVPPRYIHSNSALASVVLKFRSTRRPASVPSLLVALTGLNSDETAFWTSTFNLITTWAAGTSYALNSYVAPLASQTGFYYKATAVGGGGGVSSLLTEPTWPTVLGGTVIDNPGFNQITWTCIGQTGALESPSVDAYYNGGAPQSLTVSFDNPALNLITTESYHFVLTIQSNDPNVIYHSATFSFSNITSMRFE